MGKSDLHNLYEEQKIKITGNYIFLVLSFKQSVSNLYDENSYIIPFFYCESEWKPNNN